MKTALPILCLLLGVAVGPLAIVTFLPLGDAIQLQPVLIFGIACFASGALAVAMVVIGALMAMESMNMDINVEKEDADKSVN